MADRIFVQIASYRDPQLPRTVAHAIERAADPARLTFGICWQYDEATAGDLDPWATDRRFSIDEVYYRHGEGLGWARNRCNRLYAGEEYTLQVDAHTRFAPGWDEGFVEMHRSLPHGRSLLTTYPPGYTVQPDGSEVFDDATIPRRLKLVEQRPDGAIMMVGMPISDATEPGPSAYLGGCLLFGAGAFVVDVPHDPLMYFHGEELALAVRAFTHGYDFWYPHRNLVWHHYYHGARTHWDDRADHGERHRRAVARLRELLVGDLSTLGDYGTGDRRTRESYFEIAGLCY